MKLLLTSLAFALTLACAGQSTSLQIARVGMVPAAYIYEIMVGEDGMLYLSTTQGLISYNHNEQKVDFLIKDQAIMGTSYDQRVGLWAISQSSLIEVSTGTEISLGAELKTNDVAIYKGMVWVATSKGLITVNPTTHRIETFTTRNSKVKSDQINALHADRKGIMWLGTNAGEIRVEDKKWKSYHPKEQVRDMFENDEGIWFLAKENMWLVDEFNREYDVGLDASLYEGNINDFVLDSKGVMYVASNKLIRYNPYDSKIEEFREGAGLLSKQSTALAIDIKDNIWVGTPSGLYRLAFGDTNVSPLSAAIIVEKPLDCYGGNAGELQVFVSGGETPYTYSWTGMDRQGDKITNVKEGTYIVKVKDAEGTEVEAKIDFIAPEPIGFVVTKSTKPSKAGASDGVLEIRGTGGKPPYQYKWESKKSGRTLTALKAGDYAVTITDASGCLGEVSIPLEDGEPIQWLSKDEIKVGETILVNEVYFLADSTNVTNESYKALDDIYTFMTSNSSVVVEIGGHTNTVPSHEYCDQLSTARAKSIAEYLYEKGISPQRLTYKGYGKRNPVTDDTSMEGRRKNQRVELKILNM